MSHELTERERATLTLVEQALTDKEIARRLGVSHRTIESRMEVIRQKLGARNRSDVLRMRYEARIAGLEAELKRLRRREPDDVAP